MRLHNDAEFLRAFASMQNVYVPDSKDAIPIDRLRDSAEKLRDRIKEWDF